MKQGDQVVNSENRQELLIVYGRCFLSCSNIKFSSLYMYYKRVLFKSSITLIAATPFLSD